MSRRRGFRPFASPHYVPPQPARIIFRVRAENFRIAPQKIGEPMLAMLAAIEDAKPRRGVLPPVDDNYWFDVLADPRGRTPTNETRFAADSYYAYARLDRQPGRIVTVECACGERKVFDKAELIRSFGPDANIVWLARKIVDCGNRDKVANYCHAIVKR